MQTASIALIPLSTKKKISTFTPTDTPNPPTHVSYAIRRKVGEDDESGLIYLVGDTVEKFKKYQQVNYMVVRTHNNNLIREYFPWKNLFQIIPFFSLLFIYLVISYLDILLLLHQS